MEKKLNWIHISSHEAIDDDSRLVLCMRKKSSSLDIEKKESTQYSINKYPIGRHEFLDKDKKTKYYNKSCILL